MQQMNPAQPRPLVYALQQNIRKAIVGKDDAITLTGALRALTGEGLTASAGTLRAEQRSGALDERPLGDAAVPGERNLRERVVDARRDARGVITLDADAARDGVRRLEADTLDLGGESVGMLLEHIEGKGAVPLEDARGKRAREPVPL